MLDRNRLYAHNVRGGARVSHGPRTLAKPTAAATASTFNGI